MQMTDRAQRACYRLLRMLREKVKPDQAMLDVRAIWETDRWFTFPKFEQPPKMWLP
jgi:hypothetical protein